MQNYVQLLAILRSRDKCLFQRQMLEHENEYGIFVLFCRKRNCNDLEMFYDPKNKLICIFAVSSPRATHNSHSAYVYSF